MKNDGLPLYTSEAIEIKSADNIVLPPPVPQKPEPVPQMIKSANNIVLPPPVQQTQGPVPQKNLLGPENTVTTCQFCRASIKTAVKYTTTSRTHMAAALWGLLCCLCCVPYGADSAKNSDHYCPNCQRYLGTYVK